MRRVQLLFLSSAVLGSCAPDAPASIEVPEALVEVRRIQLEENDTVVSMMPVGNVGEAGELVVAEPVLSQVRLHGPEGDLRQQFGNPGEGPGEFRGPIDAVVRRGEVWALDVVRGLLRWDAETGELRGGFPVPPNATSSLLLLNDSTLVVAGTDMRANPALLLHVLHARDGEHRGSFFEVAVDPARRGLFLQFFGAPFDGWQDDQIVTANTLQDTARIFRVSDGNELGKIPLPIPGFTYEGTLPDSTTLAKLRLVSDLHTVPDDRLVVQYQIPSQPQPRYGLLLVAPDGELLHHEFPVRRLIDIAWPYLYFGDSTGLQPGEITVMQYR